MLTLEIFGFQALWSPYFLAVLLCIIALYFLLLGKLGKHFNEHEPFTIKQGGWFTASILLLYIIKGSPVDLMAHLMFYMHMLQMAVLVLIIPPMMILGIPDWAWQRLFHFRSVHNVFAFFTKPVTALILFNGLFSFYHIPFIFDHVMPNRWLHAGYAGVLFIFAVFMWWPLINKLPEWQRLEGINKVAYIFADGILLTPACALIIFATSPMYATYADPTVWGAVMSLCVGAANFASLNISGPELFSSMSLLHDQQLGGVLMKVIQEIIYGIILGQVFVEWYNKDRAESEQELNHQLHPPVLK